MSGITWKWKWFSELSGMEVHDILSVRQEVFVVEQNCAYLDADELDPVSRHLIGRNGDGEIVAYARLNEPGSRYEEPSMGRLLTRKKVRKDGAGRDAVREVIATCNREYPGLGMRISAQTYLLRFYTELGFSPVGAPYDEDGIEHIDMVREKTGGRV